MKTARTHLASLFLVLAALGLPDGADAQFGGGEAVGQFYRLTLSAGTGRYFEALQIERVSRLSIAMPPPIQPLPLRVPLSALTGQIIEVPDRQRIYFTAADANGTVRLFEVDLLTREARQVVRQPDVGAPYAAFFQAPTDASKLYVVWFAPGLPLRTEIYEGLSLAWLGRTSEFRPDERASGFEHRPPYMWTLDPANRPVLVDTHRDRVVRVVDLQRLFGPVHGVAADAWRDLLLFRLDVGHDRYRLYDVVSGEIGPSIDLDGYRHAHPRLVLGGRLLALIDMVRRQPRAGRSWAETAVATGGGVVHDLRSGERLEDFNLIVPHEFPVSAVGTTADPSMHGRLWIHVPGDDLRFDFGLPACDRKSPAGDKVDATLAVRWESSDPSLYRYRVAVAPSSAAAVGAVAVQSGRLAERTSTPEGWGVDLIKSDDWVRWSNGLGPADEDVRPGTSGDGFVIAAPAGARPGIVEYRVQGAIGLPRGCESDDRFLKNSLAGHTVGPETVESAIPRKLAQRLEQLVDKVCDIGWLANSDCATLKNAAREVLSAEADRAADVDRFLDVLARSRSSHQGATLVLTDAAKLIKENLELYR